MDNLLRCKVPDKPCYALTPRGKCIKKEDCIFKQKTMTAMAEDLAEEAVEFPDVLTYPDGTPYSDKGWS